MLKNTGSMQGDAPRGLRSPASAARRRLVLSTAGAWGRSLLPSGWLLVALPASHAGEPAARTVREARAVADFDDVLFAATGELHVVQSRREALSIEAEPAVLRRLTSTVHARRLTLGVVPGELRTSAPVRFRLEVRSLHALELRSSGSVRLGALDTDALSLRLSGSGTIELEHLSARRLELRLDGSGDIAATGGAVELERIAIDGAGSVRTAGLASRDAEVSIDGSGDVDVNASRRLAVRIAGSGSVRYSGDPQLSRSVSGAGTVEPLDGSAEPRRTR